MSMKRLIKKIATTGGALILTITILCSNMAYAETKKLNMSYIFFGNSSQYSTHVSKTQNSLQVISPNYFNLDEKGNLKSTSALDKGFVSQMHSKNIQVIPFLSNHWDRKVGRLALENKDDLVKDICELIKKYDLDGINIDLENLTEKDRDDYTEFVKLMRKNLPSDKVVSVAVAPNPYGTDRGWQGSYDYEELSKYSDYLIIMTYDESYPGGPSGPVASLNFVEESIKYTLKKAPKEKIMLGIPFFGRFWDEDGNVKGHGISLNKVDNLLKTQDSQVTFEQSEQSAKAVVDIKSNGSKVYLYGKELEPGKYTIWYENDESIKSKLRLVQKYDLKGTASWSLGQESADVWNYYNLWLNGHYFNDTEKHWAREAILNMESKGWMKGTSEVTFSPEKPLTRAQAAVIYVRALGLKEKEDSVVNLSDVKSNHWGKKEIDIAAQHEIIKGYEDGSFQPEKSISREEMAVLLDRILSQLPETEDDKLTYDDINEKRWSFKSISKMTNNSIFKGFEDNTFRPIENITRGQMAVLMDRVSSLIEDK